MAKDLVQARDLFDHLADCLHLTNGTDLRLRWEGLLTVSAYQSTLAQMPRLSGKDPFNLESLEPELLSLFRHDLLAKKTLSKGTFIALFPGNAIVLGDYAYFVALLAMRLMAERPAPLLRDDLLTLSNLIDRLFFGVEKFTEIEGVPEVVQNDYIQLRQTRVPSNVGQVISSLSEVHKHQLGNPPDSQDFSQFEFRSGQLLLAASARRNGRKVATAEDACNAIEALMAIFHDDILSLPLVERFSPTA